MTVDALIDLLSDACPVFVPVVDLPADTVREALALGIVSTWEDSPVGPAILISSLTCERLGLVLSGETDIERSRWIPADADRPEPCFVPTLPEGFDAPGYDASPLAEAIRSELSHRRWDPNRPERPVPMPTVILGTGRPDWRPAIEAPASPCPICQGQPLAENVACLGCLRSGIDDRLPEVPESERPGRYQDLEGGTAPTKARRSASGRRPGRPRKSGRKSKPKPAASRP